MGISVGKLSLYVAGAGIRPWSTIPICIDLGTDNEKNLSDPFYLGLRMKRRTQEEATEFMDEFMEAMHAEFPELVIQHEDFATDKAFEVRRLPASPRLALTRSNAPSHSTSTDTRTNTRCSTSEHISSLAQSMDRR